MSHNQGPYERRAEGLLHKAEYLLFEEDDVEFATAATRIAQAYATLNLTDELTRFINTTGITIR